MFEEERALNALKAEFPNLNLKFVASKAAAIFRIGNGTDIIIDPGKDIQEWIAIELSNGTIKPIISSKLGRNDKLLLLTIYESLQGYYTAELAVRDTRKEESRRERAAEYQAWKEQATKVNVSNSM